MKGDLWLLYWQEYEDITPIAVYMSKQTAEKDRNEIPEYERGNYYIDPVEDRLAMRNMG